MPQEIRILQIGNVFATLDVQEEGANITVNTLHPGAIRTKLVKLDGLLGFITGKYIHTHINYFLRIYYKISYSIRCLIVASYWEHPGLECGLYCIQYLMHSDSKTRVCDICQIVRQTFYSRTLNR